MKKLFTVFLTLIVVMSLCILSSSAESCETDLFVIARQVFPEYASKLTMQKNTSNQFFTTENNPIVVCETRQVSENELITYQEYSDGTTFVIQAVNPYSSSYTLVDSSTGTGYAYRKIDIHTVCSVASGDFWARGVYFTHMSNGTSTIGSTGSLSSSTTSPTYVWGQRLNGTTSSPAYVDYYAMFSGSHDCLIRLTVSGTNFSIYAQPM